MLSTKTLYMNEQFLYRGGKSHFTFGF